MPFISRHTIVIKRAGAATRRNLRKWMEVSVQQGQANTPVDTGHNKSRIFAEFVKRSGFIFATNSGYGGWLELGTSRTPPRPYMDPAWKAGQRVFERLRGRAWE